MCEWCDRLVFMPPRWDRHAFHWAMISVQKIGHHSEWNRTKYLTDKEMRPGLEKWCDEHSKNWGDIGRRYYPGGHGSRFYWRN